MLGVVLCIFCSFVTIKLFVSADNSNSDGDDDCNVCHGDLKGCS